MRRHELVKIKRAEKKLRGVVFRPFRKGMLPRPFDKIGGPRLQGSGLVDIGEAMAVLFYWRDGGALERRAFYGHLLRTTAAGLMPLAIMHYHPSHKGIHLVTNCEMNRDYTGRLLPGAAELAIETPVGLDPAVEVGRLRLVNIFCERCGIRLAPDDEQLL